MYGLYGFFSKKCTNRTDCMDFPPKNLRIVRICSENVRIIQKSFGYPWTMSVLLCLYFHFLLWCCSVYSALIFFLYLIWHRQQHFLSFKKIYMLQRQIKCNNLLYKFINVEELSWIRSQNSGIDILVWKEFIYYFF